MAADNSQEPTNSKRAPLAETMTMREQYKALAFVTLVLTLCLAIWGMIAPLAPLLSELFSLSATEVGILVATPILLGSLFRIPIGILADRFGGRVVFSSLMLFLVVPLAFIGLSSSYWMLLFWAFWLGIAGSSFAIGIPFITSRFPVHRQGWALGIYRFGNIGAAMSGATAPTLSKLIGWQAVFLGLVPFLLLMTAVFWIAVRDAPSKFENVPTFTESVIIFRTRPLAWLLGLFYFVTFGGFVAMSVFLPTLLVQLYNLGRADAGLRAAGFVVLATLVGPAGGYLAGRFSGAFVLMWVFISIALFALVLGLEPGIALASVGFLGLAVALGLGNGANQRLVSQLFPSETGTITGIVGAARGIGGFLPPIILGLAKDTTDSYAPGFALLATAALVCFLLTWHSSIRHRQDTA